MTSPFQNLLEQFSPNYERYEAIYKQIHANPELSWQEHETAALISKTLEALSVDFDIRKNIGGTGLIAILRNGSGPTVLLRADMDALPVKENSGLDYESHKEMRDEDNVVQSTMHACGHDMHVAALLAAAEILLSSREIWAGTLVFLFQPAEEKASGARAMIDDGLFTKHGCPIPDILLGQHVCNHRAGSLQTRPGPLMMGADGIKITVFGRGGHGSFPHTTVDPVVLASHIVIRLQSIVSREVPPGEPAVVTVGAMNAGTAGNIISDRAVLEVSTRSLTPQRQTAIIDSIKRIVRNECQASNSPKDPLFEYNFNAPPLVNDNDATTRLNKSFKAHFGDQHDPSTDIVPASEDFGVLGNAIDRPSCFWLFGGHEPEDWDEKNKEGRLADIPTNHSPFFAPCIQPTLRTGAEGMTIAALTFLLSKATTNGTM